MCLVITGILCALAINFYIDGDTQQALYSGVIAILFLGFFIYNLITNIKKRKKDGE